MPKLKALYNKDADFFRLLIVGLAVFAFCSIIQPKLFLTSSNFLSIAKQFPEYGLLAIGIGLALLTGGIDLSTVSVANLSAIVAATIMLKFAPKGTPQGQTILIILLSLVLAILIGLVCGSLNGLLISKLGIPAILTTLGTQQLIAGIAIVLTEGKPLSGLPILYSKIGNKTLFGILPVSLIVFILCATLVGLILGKTSFGAKIYMVGTNPKAARYAGINNAAVLIKTYALSGGLAAVSGMIMMARANSAKADFGTSYTLQAVLIAVLGGIDPAGGKGKIRGIVVAVVILQMLSSCLSTFENISNFYRDVIWGVVLIAVLISNHYIAKRQMKAK